MNPTDVRPVTIWAKLPATWVQVHATFSAPGRLDALEQVALRLVAKRRRTTAEIAELLGGIPEVVVENALRGLADAELVQEEEGAVGQWSAAPIDAVRRDDPELGWVVICPITERIIPEFVSGARPEDDRFEHEAFELCEVDISRFAPPSKLTDESLRVAVRRGIDAPGDSERELASGEKRSVSGLAWDSPVGYPTKPRTERRSCWVRIDLVPSLTGTVEIVCFEPCVVPCASSERPTSRLVREWLKDRAAAVWGAVNDRVSQLRVDNSVVLRAAGMQSMEDVDHGSELHREEWARVYTALGMVLPKLDPSIARALDDAHRWFVIWRQRSDFVRATYYSYADLVERLTQTLAARSRPTLDVWADSWTPQPLARRKERAKELADERLLDNVLAQIPHGDVLQAALRSSAPHLRAALRKPQQLIQDIGATAGAGGSITQWLLPLVLGEASERETFAKQLVEADQRCKQGFAYLDTLIEFRNDCMHGRDPKLTVPRVDELLRDVLFALHPWLVGAG